LAILFHVAFSPTIEYLLTIPSSILLLQVTWRSE
jgi:hypothetical protein